MKQSGYSMAGAKLDETTRRMQDLAVRWTGAQSTVAAFIRSLVLNHHDAEDVLQRTAAALVSNYDDFDGRSPFVAWAIGVARIEVLRYRQERKRDRIVFDDATLEYVAEAYSEHGPELAEMQSALDRCIATLGGRVKEIIGLYYGRQLQPAQIASVLSTSPGSVSAALHRGRTAIRRCLERQLGELGGPL